MRVAEISHLHSGKEGGRAAGAAPARPYRLVAANDNRAPRNPRTLWLAAILAAAALGLILVKAGLI